MIVTFKHTSGKTRQCRLSGAEPSEIAVLARNWLAMQLAGEGAGEPIDGWHIDAIRPVERAVNIPAMRGKETR